MKTMRKWLAVLCVVAMCCFVSAAYADAPLKSSHYEFDESVVGGGGLINESSPDFQAGESIGDLTNGNSASSNFQFNGGYTTTNDPALAFSVSNPNASFGNFSTGVTATATATFQVSDYTSYGYVVQILGNPPSNGGHTLAAMGTTGGSTTGIEQFGINLVANTSPISFGANPNHGQFGFGSASTNYGTSNVYRYVSGETIASAPKSSGVTIYTISYIANVSSVTQGGNYTGGETLLCTGTY